MNVYGGFAGNETDLSQRDIASHVTVLDGQNSQRVLCQTDYFTVPTTWDGFTIQNGYNISESGAGVNLLNRVTLSHCNVINNTAQGGAGIYVDASAAQLDEDRSVIDSCYIAHNTARSGNAGGIYVNGAQVKNCIITQNSSYNGGGGIYAYNSLVDHCVITRNSTSGYGGGLYLYATAISANYGAYNCLIAHNTASYGGGVYASGLIRMFNTTIANNKAFESTGGVYFNMDQNLSVLNNCVIWGNEANDVPSNIYNNVTFQNLAIEGGLEGNDDVMVLEHDNYGSEAGKNYPFFVLPENDNYHLRNGSALINAGMNSENLSATDLDGGARLYGERVDIGCYECWLDPAGTQMIIR